MDNNILTFLVPGPPHGQERPRVVRRGGRSITYDPEKSRGYKLLVQFYLTYEMKRAGWTTEAGPIAVSIDVGYPIPKSYNKSKVNDIECGILRPTKKPDADNIAKAILDALSGYAYKDDCQVIELVVCKRFMTKAYQSHLKENYSAIENGFVLVKVHKEEAYGHI